MKRLLLLLLILLVPTLAFAQTNDLEEYRGTLTVGAKPGTTILKHTGAYGEHSTLEWVSTEITTSSGTEVIATDLIPAGHVYYGCVAEVTQTITGATAWELGDGSNDDLWANNQALTAGTVTDQGDFTADPRGFSTSAADPEVNSESGSFTGGKIRISCLVQGMDMTVLP